MIGGFLASAAVSYMFAQRYDQWKKQSENPVQPPKKQARKITKPKRGDLEGRFYINVEKRIDKLLGNNKRTQFLEQLESKTELQDPDDVKEENRHLIMSASHATGTIVVAIFVPRLLVFTLPTTLFLASQSVLPAWHSLRKKHSLNTHVIEVAAISLAIVSGFWQVAAVSPFLFAAANKLWKKSQGESQPQLLEILTQDAKVWVLREGIEIEVPLNSILLKDIIVVRSGEIVPIDGVVISGRATVDQRIIDNSSKYSEKRSGDSIFAFSVLINGRLKLRVEKTGDDTVAAKMTTPLIEDDENQKRNKFQTEQLVNRFVPSTLLLSALAYPMNGGSGALAVLWSGFGYTLHFTSPMQFLKYLRAAADENILVKDGVSFETLAQVDTLVFNKTSLLTDETPELRRIHTLALQDENRLLAYAAAVSQDQAEPISRAIQKAAKQRQLTIPESSDCIYRLGHGVEATVAGHTIKLGNIHFIRQSGVKIPEYLQTLQLDVETLGHSMALLLIDGQLAGAIELRPQVSAIAKRTIQRFKAQGIKTYIVSAESEVPTRTFSQALGAEQYFAHCSAEHKGLVIKKLQDKGKTICFIGDSTHDSIALKQADLSVSLPDASKTAISMAEIVLMESELRHLEALFALGKQFQQQQQRNINFAPLPSMLSIGSIFALHTGIFFAAIVFLSTLALGVRNAHTAVVLPYLGDDEKDPIEE